jgi:hypothetical protein
MSVQETEKVKVLRACCEKCRNKTFYLYRRHNDLGNWILVCTNCNYAVEFRTIVTWKAEIINK